MSNFKNFNLFVGLAAAALLSLGGCSKEAPSTETPVPTESGETADADTASAAKATDKPQAAAPVAATKTHSITEDQMKTVFDSPINTLDGKPSALKDHQGKALLVVNVASKCGLTPQYEDLEKLHKEYKDRGFAVVGFPCNQFGGQEPGTAEEIKEFCSLTYGVTFPMFEKVEVNGDGRHPIYTALTEIPDAKGEAGDIQWNFEKFLIAADGKTITRFRPKTKPYDPTIIAAIEAGLPKQN